MAIRGESRISGKLWASMTPAIRKLTKILPPPSQPVEASGDWDEVERTLGTALPDDYKEFISLYGTGFIGGAS
jgi:hypothetical protein